MARVLDDIRRQAGIPTAAGGRPVAPSSPRTAAGSPSARRVGISMLLAASRGAPADLTPLRPTAITLALLSAATAVGHGWATGWVAERTTETSVVVYDWLFSILTVVHAHRWAPVTAAVAAVALVIVGTVTGGFRQGRAPETLGVVVAAGVGGVASASLLVAVAVGALTAMLVAVLYVAGVVLGIMLLGWMIRGLFE